MSAHTDNEIVIAAPFDLTWSMANDVESWPLLFADEYAEVVVLDRQDDRIRFRIVTHPINGTRYRWVSDRYLDRDRGLVTARRIDVGPFRYMHIFQHYQPVHGGTLMRWVQDFEMRPDAPLTDTEMRQRIDRGARANQLRHKEIIEERARLTAGAGREG